MSNVQNELIRLELGISYYGRNDWSEWYANNSEGKRAKGSPEGEKKANKRVVTAVIEQIGLDGSLHVNRVAVYADTNLLSSAPDNRAGGKETS